MKNIFQKIKKYLKKFKTKFALVGLFAVMASFLSQSIFPLGVQAANPQFNIFTPYVHTQTYNRDYYLLDVKNDTQGTNWGFPLSANAGDTLTFYLYYHNGINGSTANNVTVRVALPSDYATSHNVAAYLWADNATNATLQNPISQTVPINLSSSQKLEYVSGSAHWYPNQADWRTSNYTAFPNSQSDSQLFTASGLNLGSIDGCWEFSGAVVFQAKVSNIQNSTVLSLDKKMKNITNNDATFTDSVNAYPRQRIAVQLTVANNGSGILSATNVNVKDTLPSRLLYLAQTTTIDGVAANDGIAGASGLNLGSMAPGTSKTIYFETEVAIESQFTRGVTSLTNTAVLSADSINSITDTAEVVVTYTGCAAQYNMPGLR